MWSVLVRMAPQRTTRQRLIVPTWQSRHTAPRPRPIPVRGIGFMFRPEIGQDIGQQFITLFTFKGQDRARRILRAMTLRGRFFGYLRQSLLIVSAFGAVQTSISAWMVAQRRVTQTFLF